MHMRYFSALFLLGLSSLGCGLGPTGGGEGLAFQPYTFASRALAPLPSDGLVVSSNLSGVSPSYTASVDIPAGALQTFFASLQIPASFGFNGFQTLGPELTQIGAFAFDTNFDGVPELVVPLRASSPPQFAAIDANHDGKYTAGIDFDIVAEQLGGGHTISFTTPLGGDGSAGFKIVPIAMRGTLTIFPGIFTNGPPGMHDFDIFHLSVDPDSGDADDGANLPPLSMNGTFSLTVAPSPLTGLNHFLCYKAKLAKGTLCAAGAPLNAGGTCAGDQDCGGLAGGCGKNAGPQGLAPQLADPFGDKSFDVKKALSFCAPASKNLEAIPAPSLHLRGYGVKETKGTPKHVRQTMLTVVNQFGTTVVDTVKPVELLVPSVANPVGPAGPAPANDDHYTCYKVKPKKGLCAGNLAVACKRSAECGLDGPCLGKLSKRLSATIDDPFTIGSQAFAVTKATRLCVATGRDGTPPANGEGHLMCYRVKPQKRACLVGSPGIGGSACKKEQDCGGFEQPFPTSFCRAPNPTAPVMGLHVTNALGVERVNAAKQVELCIPSLLL